jgi:RND superfamily putative drug exporter
MALAVALAAPDLTRLTAERPAPLLPPDAESARGAALVARAWPEQASPSTVLAGFHRPGGLTADDRDYVRRLAVRFQAPDRPAQILR